LGAIASLSPIRRTADQHYRFRVQLAARN